MRRFTGPEKGGLMLAAALIIGGFCMVVHPMEMFVTHGGYWRSGNSSPDHISEKGAREIGGGVILAGVAFAAFVLYRPRK